MKNKDRNEIPIWAIASAPDDALALKERTHKGVITISVHIMYKVCFTEGY